MEWCENKHQTVDELIPIKILYFYSSLQFFYTFVKITGMYVINTGI